MHFFVIAFALLLVGIALGYFIRAFIFLLKKNSLELSVQERLMHARETAQTIVTDAQKKVDSELARLAHKDTTLEERERKLDTKATALEKKSELLEEREQDIETAKAALVEELESISGLTREEAYVQLVASIEAEYAEDFAARASKLNLFAEEALKDRAKNILTTVIQRLAVPTTNELTTSSVVIENEEIKGKVIGKEGRNIRAFERASGVELLVDEVPGSIVVSCFDPVRRAIAVHALTTLIKDGRIQPAKIEEEVENAKNAINDIIKEKGAAAVSECAILNLDPRVVAILGRLHFRTSYGQNVLQHSIEMSHIADMLAREIGADSYIARAGALVHDIGKALDHEIEGTHVDIGIRLLRKFNTDERIITAMKSHHDDVPHETLEAIIVQVADMISGARPGARRDTAEMYLKRLQELESLAARFGGVEKVYALQAGREIRIFVHPESVTDFEARNLARTIAIHIEQELRYPGQIKVTIIRETRIIDFAR